MNLNAENWVAPAVTGEIPHGDMPGDKVEINDEHIRKAQTLFPHLLRALEGCLAENPSQRAVVAVCGGSGVGKSEIASLLSYYLNHTGIGSYTLSGDNYPHRIPIYNDAERLRVFRTGGLRGLVDGGLYTDERMAQLRLWWADGVDADPGHAEGCRWMQSYLQAGVCALAAYLGSDQEQDFAQIGRIVAEFKWGAPELYLKRMGRTESELWYEKVNMRAVSVLMIEWTHGNSDGYQGVDVPILLDSTPEETLAHRRARARDKGVDSTFTTLVLELEQRMLMNQAHKAKLILSKSGELMGRISE